MSCRNFRPNFSANGVTTSAFERTGMRASIELAFMLEEGSAFR